MRFLTVSQMRAADHAAITEGKIPEMVLMSRAGTALARAVEKVAALRQVRSVLLVAGHGNNGGDACVAARCLYEDGFQVQVVMTCVPALLKGAAREAWDEMRTAGVPYVVLASKASWVEDVAVFSGAVVRYGVLVDGLLGTGCAGAPTGVVEQAIRWINRMRPHTVVVSADLPSGMNGDTGETAGAVVHADVTVTFERPKTCFLNDRQSAAVGHLLVAGIGIPDAYCERGEPASACQLMAFPELMQQYAVRGWDDHKGKFGHLCVIGGAAGFGHAPVLAALGALRSGAGLVTLAVHGSSAAAAAAWVPESMCHVVETSACDLSQDALAAWGMDLGRFDVIVAGPGLTASERVCGMIGWLLETVAGKLVLDADGLNALACLWEKGWRPKEGQQLMLTPHPGEAARLLGVGVGEIQNDRQAAVRQLADRYGAVVILKGAGTLVCSPGGNPWLNRTGNPGMASGGMGDVLAGMAGAWWAQGRDALSAATVAVWAHGTAGDFALLTGGETTLSATLLVEQLGKVYPLIERPPM